MRGRGLIVVLLLAAGCRPPPPAESPPTDVQEMKEVEASLTQDDLESIREAIASGIEASDSEEMRSLTGNTATTSCTIDENGTARIGLWVLWKSDGPGLRFVWRRAGTYGPAFVAHLEKGPDGWVLTSLGPFHISPPKK